MMAHRKLMLHRSLGLAVLGAALLLGGCKLELARAGCTQVKADELQVAKGQTCKFRYDQGDMALYSVVITQAPAYGQATADGKYLTYAAKPGFVGEDRLAIKVVRKGVGHVQWQDKKVRVKVGS